MSTRTISGEASWDRMYSVLAITDGLLRSTMRLVGVGETGFVSRGRSSSHQAGNPPLSREQVSWARACRVQITRAARPPPLTVVGHNVRARADAQPGAEFSQLFSARKESHGGRDGTDEVRVLYVDGTRDVGLLVVFLGSEVEHEEVLMLHGRFQIFRFDDQREP